MSRELLTAHRIRAISKPGVYKDGAGLRLVVTARGTKRWELWISINGKKRMKRKQLSNAKHLRQWPSTMETYVFPVLGNVPIADITASQVIDVLDPIWYDKPETAKRVLQRIEAVFKSAILRGAREKASPCVGVVQEFCPRHREVQHHAALSWQEVPAFVAMLQRPPERGWPSTRLAFEFLILTATRSSETREALWSEFDLEKAIWVIPRQRMKSRKVHSVPLSARCLAILREARALNPDGLLVFEGTKRGRPLSDMTSTKLLRDVGLGERATAHGFRSSFKSWCAEAANALDDVSEAALAHTIRDRVKAAYLRIDFVEQRRLLMEDWAKYCKSDCHAKPEGSDFALPLKQPAPSCRDSALPEQPYTRWG